MRYNIDVLGSIFIKQGKTSPGSASVLSSGSSSSFGQSPSPGTTQSHFYEPYQNLTNPASFEITSNTVIKQNGKDNFDGVDKIGDSGLAELEINQALRRLEEQLSLNDDSFKEFGPICSQDEDSNNVDLLEYERKISNEEQFSEFDCSEQNVWNQCYSGSYGAKGNRHISTHYV